MSEIANQLHSDRLILSHGRFIILRKPAKKLPKALRCQRPSGSAWHHKRLTIEQGYCEVNALPVISLQGKSRPVVRLRPLFVVHHFELGTTQCRTRAFTPLYSRVQTCHEFCRSLVIDFPQTRNDAFGACIQETPWQADDPLCLEVLAQSGFAGTKYHQ